MKINGKSICGPYIEIIPIIREGQDIIFKAKAILSYDPFTALCPVPKPPLVHRPGKGREPDTKDNNYISATEQYGKQKTGWMIMESLSATEGLEFSFLKNNDPNTWANWEKEFVDAGFTEHERVRILLGVMSAQGLNDEKIEEARSRFLVSVTQEATN